MSLLNFLKTSTVEEVASPARAGGGRKQWNPSPAIVAIRVWKDGSIFPSQAAVDKFDLEYRKSVITKEPIKLKENETEADQKFRNVYGFPDGTGNGLDLIDSRQWPQVKGDGAMLFVAVVPKDAGKVDFFNTVAYGDDGTPKTNVMDQGSNTFGKDVLLPAIEEVYGVKFNRAASEDGKDPGVKDGVDFLDLAIFESLGEGEESFNVTEHYSKPILHVPKRITRGADKGKADYIRRENVKVYGLAPASEVLPGYKQDTGKQEQEEEEETVTEGPSATTGTSPVQN